MAVVLVRGVVRPMCVAMKTRSLACYDERCGPRKKGCVLGAWEGCCPGEYKFTPALTKLDECLNGKISCYLKNAKLKFGKATVFTNVGDFYAIAISSLGREGEGFNENEMLDVNRENVRTAAAVGALALQRMNCRHMFVDGMCNAEAAAEGAALAIWTYQEYKYIDNREPEVELELYEDPNVSAWERGLLKADAQNLARKLEEMPANVLTPASFSQLAIEILCPLGVEVEVRDRDWMEAMHMDAFLYASRASCCPPLLLELAYCGGHADDKPVLFVGQGTTFDSGGVCLKPCDGNFSEMKGDMAGGAVVVAVLKAAACLNLPINVCGLIPLCENMPGGLAMKPGDVVRAMNGKTICIKRTDHEGRVLLADILTLTKEYKPCLVISIASLAEGMRKALGTGSTGAFTCSNIVWNELNRAGVYTGDRVWRFPLWDHYNSKVTKHLRFDVSNVGNGVGGDPCSAAAFLNEFLPADLDFVHLDVMGTGLRASGVGTPYLRKGLMTGRPTRTLIQFLYQMTCPT